MIRIPIYTSKPASSQTEPLTEVKTLTQLEELKKTTTDKCLALLFWADWHPPCHQLRDQLAELAKIYKEIRFTWVSISFSRDDTHVQCNSDEAQDLVDKLDVNAVPTLAMFHPHKAQPEILENPSPEKVAQVAEVQNEFY